MIKIILLIAVNYYSLHLQTNENFSENIERALKYFFDYHEINI